MIENFLRSKIGLNVESVGKGKIVADASRRMKECGIDDASEYLKLIGKSPEELGRLVDIVTVPETWFYRSMKSFEYLENYIKFEWLPQNAGKKIRILSMPCSTGEEPYSIAIALMECGLKLKNISIDAGDVNRESLKKAQRGVYSGNSFRGKSLERLDAYFTKNDGLFYLDERVKKAVNFFSQNMLQFEPLPMHEARYDIIFCRNMLIYFDKESQRKTVEILSGLLKEDGLLFLGHAETGVLMDSIFRPVKAQGSFAFKKDSTPRISILTLDTQRIRKLDIKAINAHRDIEALPKPSVNRRSVAAVREKTMPGKVEKAKDLLRNAEELANNGELKRAMEVCREYVERNKLNPGAYFLMGVISMSSSKDSDAESFFNKAVYLKPDFYEALLNLSALKERRGDLKNAENFKERARRIAEQQ